MVVHDKAFGNGSVTRVHNLRVYPNEENRHDSAKIKQEVAKNLLPDWMLIPDGGNPDAQDLISEYWQSVRRMVKKTLS